MTHGVVNVCHGKHTTNCQCLGAVVELLVNLCRSLADEKQAIG